MDKTNTEKLFENASAGFKDFKARKLEKNKKQIFDEAYEINAKTEIHSYLCYESEFELSDEDIEVLIGLGDAVIDELYAYFIDREYASIMSYGDITEWVLECCKEMKNREV